MIDLNKKTIDNSVSLAVLGTGYVGLVSGVCLASLGHKVTCYDPDSAKIEGLKQNILPIYESGLKELLDEVVAEGRISFTSDIKNLFDGAEAALVAVGTPPDPETGRADLRYVKEAALSAARHANNPLVLIHKSTVPVGTGHRIEQLLDKEVPNHKIEVASNPEFLREGQALNDFMNPDRVVAGANHAHSADLLRKLYRPLIDRGVPFVQVNRRSAEMIKYTANAFLAVKLAYINEISDLCEQTGANIEEVVYGVGLDRRISPHFLGVGPGYGGSCFPKDTLELSGLAAFHESGFKVVDAAIASNNARKHQLVSRIEQYLNKGQVLSGLEIAVLGLAFKANTDDIRDSATLTLLPALAECGAKIRLHDPIALSKFNASNFNAQAMNLNHLTEHADLDSALSGADLAVIMTEWSDYANLSPAYLKSKLRTPLLIDFRNLFDPTVMAQAGVTYHSLGRPQ